MVKLSLEIKNKLNDKEWLYDQYITKKKGTVQLGKELDCSWSTVLNYIKKHDITIRTTSEANGISKEVLDKLNDKEWLYDQYITMNKSTYQIGEELSCSHITISRYIKKYDIFIRDTYEARGTSKELLDKLNNYDWLYDQYITLKKSTIQLSKELSCSPGIINNYLKRNAILLRSSAEAHGISKEILDILNNKDFLYDQYITMKKGTVQIGNELECSYYTIIRYLNKHDIPINYSYSRSAGENQVFEFVKQAMQSYRDLGEK